MNETLEPTKPASSGSSKCLIGCLVAFVIFILLVVGGGYYAYVKIRAVAADGMHEAVTQMLADSDLPEDQKAGVMVHIDQLRDDIKAGKVGFRDAAFIIQEITEGPLLPLFMSKAAEKMYVEKSGLTAEEKADAVLQIRRFTMGVAEKKISQGRAEDAMNQVMETDPATGQDRLKAKLTDEELKAFIESLRKEADDAKITNDPPEVDLATEVGRAIEQGKSKARSGGQLGQGGTQGEDGADGENNVDPPTTEEPTTPEEAPEEAPEPSTE